MCKLKTLKIIHLIVFAITLVSGSIGFWQEGVILDANNRCKVGLNNDPLYLKGNVYYVTNEKLIEYNIATDVFIAGIFLNACFIGIRKIQENKKIDWYKLWEEQRRKFKYHRD